ncbi:hypothetical protein B0H03_11758 [Rathayibacter iranicus NCPPB 2253 = VKM Ac-1602]|uniref:Secreted protein with PEP-CTERM sorting signal n=1 Tax=Rathayibacter iranicus NCPPB 2253 = VKM Ac-1602 TaxID=1328868 RepID=A0ABX5L9S9_9MICO|nr:hypothetical protein B0H03_11758 [Rathayibacter iranicus NCPPB 2253 = VKM Ac-1602]
MDISTFLNQFGFVAGIGLGVCAGAIGLARNLARRRRER